MRSTRAKWSLCILAFVLNLGGGPMAWARVAGGADCHDAQPVAASASTSADCPDHLAQAGSDQPRPAPEMPCCDGGSCACAIVHSMPAVTMVVRPTSATALPVAEMCVHAVPADVIDDALRPPIS